jgi:ParB-like chromosome segregation protein Spo0J
MKTELVKADTLIPYARNPRKNSAAVDKIAASIKEFGWQQPIVVDKENVIIAGHTRLLAAQKLGIEDVPVHVADLTETQAKAYRLADNRLSEDADWDIEMLGLEIRELDDLNFNLDMTGFNNSELANLLIDKTLIDDDLPEQEQLKNVFEVAVECEDEQEQEKVFQMLTDEGLKCRILSI